MTITIGDKPLEGNINTDLSLQARPKPGRLWLHFVTLPRLMFAPAAMIPAVLGWLLSPSQPVIGLVLALGIAYCLSAGLHSFDSVAGWLTGVDKPGGSVEKSYTSGASVLPNGWAKLPEVALNAGAWTALGLALTGVLAWWAESWWPLLGPGLALLFGGLYGTVWKRLYMPEACGLLGFGVGGAAIGFSASGTMTASMALAGVAVTMPFAVAWGVDQLADAPSDMKRGVKNIGGLLYTTGMPVWGYVLFGAMASFVVQLFAVQVEALAPWTMLTMLTVPLWVLCAAWLAKDTETGVRFGLVAIILYMALLVGGQAIT